MYLNDSFLLEEENGLRYGVPPSRTLWSCNPITLRIKQATDLGQVAVALNKVVQHCRLAEESVAAVQDPLHSLLVGVDEGVGSVALHVTPHLLVAFDFRVSAKKEMMVRTNLFEVNNICSR